MRYPGTENNAIAHRMVKGKWQVWESHLSCWKIDIAVGPFYGPDSNFDDPIVSYEDTWCEPFEGMEDES